MYKASIFALGLMAWTGTALADTAAPMGPSPISQGLLLGGFILIFYFLLWRPQSKRAKEHRELIGKLSKGDEVVTNGGVLGKITKITDGFLILSVAPNCEIYVQKEAVARSLPKGTLKSL